MKHSPRVTLLAADGFESPYRLRLPFRFGSITVTQGRQALVRVRIRTDDGRAGDGYAAEALGAKWFDKNPALSDAQNLDQLRRALELTRDAYLAAGPMTPFDLHVRHHGALLAAGAQQALPPLVTSFGPALIDRAILDALLRIHSTSFWSAMRNNLAGMHLQEGPGDLQGFALDGFLQALAPAATLQVRHTVGLVDPIIASDQAPGSRVDDGLPETLEEVVPHYGNRYFKLKVSGQVDADIERLTRIASVLDRIAEPYFVTLDGNEQFDAAHAVTALWHRMASTPALQRLCVSTLFIEQPLKRAVALAQPVHELARCKPVIIDESDGELDSFVQAKALGYSGVSSKACKGFYKAILNRARCAHWNTRADTGEGEGEGAGAGAGAAGPYFMSAEDLTTQAGLSVQQDLALVALLGLTHVERNAHHFIAGFNGRPANEAEAFLRAHPDLYHRHQGRPHLHIQQGRLHIGSLDCAGFGCAVEPDLAQAEPMPASHWSGPAGHAT